MRKPGPEHGDGGSPGVALVITLMMMSVLVMMVVGLAGVMRNEQAAGRNLTYQVLAEQMAEIGANEAMATVLSNSPVGAAGASGPGWIFNGGNQTISTLVPLVSQPGDLGSGVRNLEEIGTNSLILGLATNPPTRGSIPAGWIAIAPPGSAPGTPPIGRYAWWVDDEGTKLNLNAVGSNNAAYLPLLTNFPFSPDYVFADPITLNNSNSKATNQAAALRNRTNYLFTPELLKDTNYLPRIMPTNDRIGSLDYRQVKGEVTTWASNREFTPWGSPLLQLSPGLSVAAVKSALSTNAWSNFFGEGMTLARKYGGGSTTSTNPGNHGDLAMEQIALNLLAMMGSPTVATSLAPSLASNNVNRHRNGLPLTLASHYVGPYLEQVRIRVNGLVTTNPTTNATVQLAIMIGVINPHPQSFSNYSLVIQPRKFRARILGTLGPGSSNWSINNLSNPSVPAPLGGVSWTNSLATNLSGGQTNGWWIGPEWFNQATNPWPLNFANRFVASNLVFSNQTRTNLIFTQQISYQIVSNLPTAFTESYVMLDSVKLQDDSTNPALIRDWVSLDDFAQQGNFFTTNNHQDNGQLSFTNGGVPVQMVTGTNVLPPLTTNDFTPTNSLILRKVDPQVRFPISHWNTVGTNRGLLRSGGWPNSATGPRAWTTNPNPVFTNTWLAYLPADPVPANLADPLDHPHFVSGYRPTNGIRSVAQLGAIHTGLPWRTLRLQPTPPSERLGSTNFSLVSVTNFPPDWTVLEMFTATNPDVSLSRLNPNLAIRSLNGTAPGWPTNAGGIQMRPRPLLGLMWAWATNPAAEESNNLVANGVPASLMSASNALPRTVMLGYVTNLLPQALTNPGFATSWSTNSDWDTARGVRANAFPSVGLALKGELLELPGWAENTNSPAAWGEDVIEGRLRCLLDMLTTRSDTFSVWSIGQGLVVNTNFTPARTNVMGEIRRQTVFQRMPLTDANGVVTGYRLRIVYSRNHTVE